MIQLHVDDQVGIIELNRPDKRNAISNAMRHQFVNMMERIRDEEQIRAVLIRGADGNFCSGADLNDFRAAPKQDVLSGMKLAKETAVMYEWKWKLGKPVISAVDGYCLGVGMALAAMSHYCVASTRAQFGLPEIKFGLAPLGVYPYLVPAVGARRALELALSGRVFDAGEARDMGLAHALTEPDRLHEFSLETAKGMASHRVVAAKLLIESAAQVEAEQMKSIEMMTRQMLTLNLLEMEKK